MSKIKIKQIGDDTVKVSMSSDTPMEMVSELTKSLLMKGLVEDLAKSTITTRYFYLPQDSVNAIADKLIKSLEGMSKDDAPYWNIKSQFANQAKNSATDKQTRMQQPFKDMQAGRVAAARAANAAPQNTAKPTKVKNFFGKGECSCKDMESCTCVEKSNYGPKGGGQYTPEDNARRKMKNVEVVDVGPNSAVKPYHGKPFAGRSGYQTDPKLKKPQPVKTYSNEEKEAMAVKMGLKKSWLSHNNIPNADEEVLKLSKRQPVDGETAAANQLMNLMKGKQMLGDIPAQLRPMFAAPPPQPTNEEMFGGGVVTEEMAKAAESKWNNTMNWLEEATKPISARFSSEEEELAYWSNLGGGSGDRDDGQSGY